MTTNALRAAAVKVWFEYSFYENAAPPAKFKMTNGSGKGTTLKFWVLRLNIAEHVFWFVHSFYESAAQPVTSKMAVMGFQNGQQVLERVYPQAFGRFDQLR